MSKKLTVLDKAIAALEGRAVTLRAKFDTEDRAMQEAIAVLRAQQAAKPSRKRKPIEIAKAG